MGTVFTPGTAEEVREVVAWAAAEETALEIVGGGSKTTLGRPVESAHRLDLSRLSGVILYEPEELVISAAAGTPLATIEETLKARGQELRFEPPDYGPLLGGASGRATVGGIFACNLSGPRRIKAGAARDFLLGAKAVNGRGEAFVCGGRVMKNVTGYDVCKLLAGSFGTLAVMTEATFKVLPLPPDIRTVMFLGLADEAAVAAMTEIAGSPLETHGLAHLPREAAALSGLSEVTGAGAAVTAARIEGPAPAIRYCAGRLRESLSRPVIELDAPRSQAFWRELGDVAPFAALQDRRVWKLSVTATLAAGAVREIRAALDALAFYDWAGGLVWLAVAGAEDEASLRAEERVVRGAATRAGGHALLVLGSNSARTLLPVFQPLSESAMALTARLKESFDPHHVLNPGRMYPGL